MADDASGGDRDEDERNREPSPTGSDVQHSAGERDGPDETWRVADRDERQGRNERIGGDDRPGRDERTDDDSAADDEYRVPLDLSAESGAEEDEPTEADTDDQYRPEPSSTPIEPGDPDLENAAFVFLGALVMVLVMFQTISIVL